jgi:hypothetical protein
MVVKNNLHSSSDVHTSGRRAHYWMSFFLAREEKNLQLFSPFFAYKIVIMKKRKSF